jgi:cytoskeletal protein RodZ
MLSLNRKQRLQSRLQSLRQLHQSRNLLQVRILPVNWTLYYFKVKVTLLPTFISEPEVTSEPETTSSKPGTVADKLRSKLRQGQKPRPESSDVSVETSQIVVTRVTKNRSKRSPEDPKAEPGKNLRNARFKIIPAELTR